MRTVAVPLLRLEFGVRWTARVLAVLLVGMVLVFLIGEGGINPLKLTTFELILMTLHLVTWIGLAVAWQWPFFGGLMAAAGTALYYAVDVAATGRFLNNVFFDLMFLAGILFMVSDLIRRRMAAG